MSNLQMLGKRCPVMGKALAQQSTKMGNSALSGAFGGTRAYHSKVPKANLHTQGSRKAQHVDVEMLRQQEGTSYISGDSG